MLFRDIISGEHLKPINTHRGQNAELLNVKGDDIYTIVTTVL
jgi:hypothetical protein